MGWGQWGRQWVGRQGAGLRPTLCNRTGKVEDRVAGAEGGAKGRDPNYVCAVPIGTKCKQGSLMGKLNL